MNHVRSGRIIIQMAVIIGLGFALGVADMLIRPIDLKPREEPPPLELRTVKPVPAAPEQAGGEQSQGKQVASAAPDAGSAAASPAPAAVAVGAFTPTPKDKLPKGQVTLDEARAAYDQGLADGMTFFVDSRKKEEFVAGHILGALRIDSKSFESGDPPELSLIPRDAIVIVYCNGGQCDESENVAKWITSSGYKRVYVLHDGFPGWKALGHPVGVGE